MPIASIRLASELPEAERPRTLPGRFFRSRRTELRALFPALGQALRQAAPVADAQAQWFAAMADTFAAIGSEDEATVVDSVLPMPVMLERFRADIPVAPDSLRNGASSPEALVGEVLRRVEASDTLGLERLAVDRAEFAYLYYESSPLSRPPYELPPAVMWFRQQQENRIGALRLLRELGGRPLGPWVLVCEEAPVTQGENRVWSGCRVRVGPGESSRDLRLFGAILERDGRFKVLSFGNDY